MEYYHFKVLQSIVISSNIYSNLLNKISIKILFTTKSCNLTINVFKWVQITYFFGGSYLEEIRDALKNEALTKTSKKIAQFVLDNVAEACFMTSTDIALKLSVSESSVIRFSRSLGFSGFMDFQKSLRKSYQTRVSSLSGSIAVPYERLVKSFEMSDNINYADEYFLNTTKNIQSVLINNDRKKFDSASKIIRTSKRKFIISSRANTGVGSYLFLLLKHMVPDVYSTDQSALNVVDHLCDITKNDCVIIFSFPRYSSLDKLGIEMAAEAGAKIIVFTDRASALLAQYATVLFTVDVDSSTFYNSYVGVQFAMEVLCAKITKDTGFSNEEKLKTIDKYLDRIEIY